MRLRLSSSIGNWGYLCPLMDIVLIVVGYGSIKCLCPSRDDALIVVSRILSYKCKGASPCPLIFPFRCVTYTLEIPAMRCIVKTCDNRVDSRDSQGYRLISCPHVYCEDCYLRLVRKIQLKKQTPRCAGCEKPVALYGEMDMAHCGFEPDRAEPATDDASHEDLVFKIGAGLLALDLHHKHELKKPESTRDRARSIKPDAAVAEVICAGAKVKVWQRRVRAQQGAHRNARNELARGRQGRFVEIRELRAELQSVTAQTSALEKDILASCAEQQRLSERVGKERAHVHFLETCQHLVARILAGAKVDASRARELPPHGAAVLALRLELAKATAAVVLMKRQWLALEKDNRKMQHTLVQNSRERALLLSFGVASWDEYQALVQDMEIVERNSVLIKAMAMLPSLCLSFLALILSVVVAPQHAGFSVTQVLN